jgi:hypothetical protein
MGAALGKPLDAGLNGMQAGIGRLKNQMSSLLSTVGTLGGAFAIGSFVHDAIEASTAAGEIAYQLRLMGEAGAVTGDVLAMATAEGKEFRTTTEEMLAAYHTLLEETGQPVFSKEVIGSVTEMAGAFRLAPPLAANLAAIMHEKLGASADVIKSELAPALLDMGNRGGVKVRELAENGNALLSVMESVGLEGVGGFKSLLGILNLTDDKGGEVGQRMAGLSLILTKLKPGTKHVHALANAAGLTRKQIDASADSVEVFQKLMSTPTGFKKMSAEFGKSVRTSKVFSSMVEPFEVARKAVFAKTGNATLAFDAGLAAYNAAVKEMSTTTSTAADVTREKAKADEETGRKWALAIGEMKDAFLKPEFLGAMKELAGIMPTVARGFAELVEFVSKHPWTSAGIYAGASAALPAVTGALGAGGAMAAKTLGVKAVEAGIPGALAVGASGKTAALAAGGTTAGAALAAGAVGFGVGTLINKGIEAVSGKQIEDFWAGLLPGATERSARGLEPWDVRGHGKGPGLSKAVATGAFGPGAVSPTGAAVPAAPGLPGAPAKATDKAGVRLEKLATAGDRAAIALERLARVGGGVGGGPAAGGSTRGPRPPADPTPGHVPAGMGH